MVKIDRAMYFIHDGISLNNKFLSLSKRFFCYWKLHNLYGLNSTTLQADDICSGFIQLENLDSQRIAESLYYDNKIDIESNIEVEVDTYAMDVEASNITIENLNAVDLMNETIQLDDEDEIFQDELDEQVRNFDWHLESADSYINWHSIDDSLLRPSDDITVVHMHDDNRDIGALDVKYFVESQIHTITENNENISNEDYIRFMTNKLNTQLEKRNTPIINVIDKGIKSDKNKEESSV